MSLLEPINVMGSRVLIYHNIIYFIMCFILDTGMRKYLIDSMYEIVVIINNSNLPIRFA